jgi:hypothetical protein
MRYRGKVHCRSCGKTGHNSSTCPDRKEKLARLPADHYLIEREQRKQQNRQLSNKRCSYCGEFGHTKASCPQYKSDMAKLLVLNAEYRSRIGAYLDSIGYGIGSIVQEANLNITERNDYYQRRHGYNCDFISPNHILDKYFPLSGKVTCQPSNLQPLYMIEKIVHNLIVLPFGNSSRYQPFIASICGKLEVYKKRIEEATGKNAWLSDKQYIAMPYVRFCFSKQYKVTSGYDCIFPAYGRSTISFRSTFKSEKEYTNWINDKECVKKMMPARSTEFECRYNTYIREG